MHTRSLAALLVRRLLGAAAVVVLVTALAWWLLHLLRPELFPDRPAWPRQWADYLTGAFLHFDLGRSSGVGGLDVAHIVREGAPADLALFAGGLAFGLSAGMLAGVVAARHERGLLAALLQSAGMVALCAPVYVVGLGLLLLFGDGVAVVDVGVTIPTHYVEFAESPWRWLGALVVPWMVLGLPLAGIVARVMYGATREAAGEEPVRTAHAKGVSARRALFAHAAPLGAAPALAVAGASANLLLTNMILTERVFAVPGVFLNLPGAVGRADAPLILALTMVGAAFIALTTTLLDVALAALDPRVRVRR